MSDKVFNVLEEKIEKTIARLHDELATVRAGRANAALVDRVTVDYYGVATPLKQLVIAPGHGLGRLTGLDRRLEGRAHRGVLAPAGQVEDLQALGQLPQGG